ncbi:hypothetical protein [Paraburkholderia saeva]|uniref:hypothetical protein n=1 Tax=Paraburkholderia saeva TaxID=2777537 RepID=UPI001D3D29F0|nr:hypothetical protein [Paraburkholderia saeva]CAG4888776.1 hypothetical protein R70241_00560 [Paraburkholderia saeva]
MFFRKHCVKFAFTVSLVTSPVAFAFAPEPGQNASFPPPGQSTAPTQPRVASDPLRTLAIKTGLDPDSESGKVFIKWVAKVRDDPDWKAVIGENGLASSRRLDFGKLNLSPAARLAVLQHFGALAALAPPASCGQLMSGGAAGFGALVAALPPAGVEQVGEMLDTAVKGRRPASQMETYTTTELLATENAIEKAGGEMFARHGWNATGTGAVTGAARNPTGCELMAGMAEMVGSMPEPDRTRATWLIVTMHDRLQFGGITNGVLARPYPYLDEALDEHMLPAALRGQIGAEGSQPLPFQSFTVTGRWLNSTHSFVEGPFEMTFLNRRNDGTVSKVIRLMENPKQPTWGHYALDYGPMTLRDQTIAFGSALTVMKQVDDTTTLVSAGSAFTENTVSEQ